MATPYSSLTRKPLVTETTGGPLMLRDFLIEDFSSCSSNGFKSFPRRRQCCPTTPRLMLPSVDRKSKLKSKPTRHSKSSSKLFRKASKAVIRAVKSLPLRSSAAAGGDGGGSSYKPLHLLPRSLSRKIFKKSLFWRKDEFINDAVISVAGDVSAAANIVEAPVTGRWRSFREFLEEQLDDHTPLPHDQAFLHGKATDLVPVAAARNSTSSSGSSHSTDHSKSTSKNWSESEFTADSSSASEGSNEGGKNDLPSTSPDGVSGGSAAVTAGDEESTTTPSWPAIAETAKTWTNDQEKEQFSPVSVLDCPFQDEEEEEEDGVSSPLQRGLVLDEGSKKKLVKRARRFECLDQLQPINLQKRITVIEESFSVSSSSDETSSTSHNTNVGPKDPLELLRIVKERASSTSTSDRSARSSITKGDQLLFLDFFEEKLLKGYAEDDDGEDELLEAVEEWMNGEAKEMMVGWEVNESRNLYLKDIDENGGWRNYAIDVEQELGLEIEDEIFTSLVNELVFEIC